MVPFARYSWIMSKSLTYKVGLAPRSAEPEDLAKLTSAAAATPATAP